MSSVKKLKVTFAQVKQALKSGSGWDLVHHLFPEGKAKGQHFEIGNIQGDPGDSLVITPDKDIWKDFAAGGDQHGDLIDLYSLAKGVSKVEAKNAIADWLKLEGDPRDVKSLYPGKLIRRRPRPPEPAVGPAPDDAPTPGHDRYGRWCYVDREGRQLMWICRYERDDGGRKFYVPYCWSLDKKAWEKRAHPAPMPIYNLDVLDQNKDAIVLITEGEKCAEAAHRLDLPGFVSTTWHGGCTGWEKADWTPIGARRVIIWPDQDKSENHGENAAKELGLHLHNLGCRVSIIRIDSAPHYGEPRTWDIADAVSEDGWDAKQVLKFINENKYEFTQELIDRAKVADLEKVAEVSGGGQTIDANMVFQDTWARLNLYVNSSGKPIKDRTNVKLALTNMKCIKAKLNTLRNEFLIKIGNDDYKELDNNVMVQVGDILGERAGMMGVSLQTIKESLCSMAMDNQYNPAQDWASAEEWDGTPRLDTFLHDIVECEDNEYTRAVSYNLWKGLYARIREPGAQVDNMCILEGKQGIRKTSLLQAMVGKDFFASIVQTRFDAKEYAMAMQGQLVVEVGELHQFKTADVEHLKQFITDRWQRFRMPYEPLPKTYMRTAILIGTTNHTEDYLADVTGNRRFWPIRCLAENIDTQKVSELRNQYIAEAKHRVESGEAWWDMPEEATAEEQAKRQYRDAWEDVVKDWARDKEEFKISEMLENALGFPAAQQSPGVQMRAGKVLRALGYDCHRKREGGEMSRVWRLPVKSKKGFEF